MSAAGRAHAMSYFTKKEEDSSSAIFSNVTRAANPPFSNYSSLYSSFPALHSTGNHDFWYCSRSRLLYNSSKITGSNQNAWEMKKYDGKPITMSILVPKGTQGIAPTAQTREEATLLMLI
uniref:Uncharacterized protein n=1 Tax=Fagus sylvatica TaxID=28930 RepID=A0A2N9HLZ8_FAGSY